MMRNTRKVYLFITLQLFAITLISQPIQKIYLDPAKAYGGKCSAFLQDMEYIPLETTSESLFGDIDQLIITDSSFVIADDDTKCVLFFSTSGKYIKKIKLRENENINLYANPPTHSVILSIYQPASRRMTNNHYSYKGAPITHLSLPGILNSPKRMIPLEGNYYINPGMCWMSATATPKDSIYHLIHVYYDTTLYKSFLGYNPKINPVFCCLGSFLNVVPATVIKDGALYVCTPNDYFVYKVNKDTAQKIAQLVFPARDAVSSKLIQLANLDKETLDSIIKEINSNSKRITGISNIFWKNNKFYFKIDTRSYTIHHGSEVSDQYNFMYDIQKGYLFSFERLSPDTSNYFLPIVGNSSINKLYGMYHFEDFSYSCVSTLEMFQAYEANKSRLITYPEKLAHYFSQNNRKANPVIVKMRLKDASSGY